MRLSWDCNISTLFQSHLQTMNILTCLRRNDVIEDEVISVVEWLPYFCRWGKNHIKSCFMKIRRYLNYPVKFIIIYNTKKVSYFNSITDKVPDLSRSNVIYQITCPGCNKSHTWKTDRCWHTLLSKHSTQFNTSVIAKRFLQCENALFMVDFYNQYDRLNNLTFPYDFKILYSKTSINTNQLLFLEALHIQTRHWQTRVELSLFTQFPNMKALTVNLTTYCQFLSNGVDSRPVIALTAIIYTAS